MHYNLLAAQNFFSKATLMRVEGLILMIANPPPVFVCFLEEIKFPRVSESNKQCRDPQLRLNITASRMSLQRWFGYSCCCRN